MNKIISTSVYATGIFLFWLLIHPESLSYQEQYQMMLLSLGYLTERLSVAGGLCDYISEFIIQFYYYTTLGAFLLTLLYVWLQNVTWRVMKHWGAGDGHYGLSFITGTLMLAYQGDENVMQSFMIALSGAMEIYLVVAHTSEKYRNYIGAGAFPLLYWALGPVALLFTALLTAGLLIRGKEKKTMRWAWAAILILLAIISVEIISRLFLGQYPWPNIWGGIGYHRNRITFPVMQFVIAIVMVALPVISSLLPEIRKRWIAVSEIVIVVAAGGIYANTCYNPFKYELLKYIFYIRNERWDDIVRRAERQQPETPMSSNCVNLALGMKGQMGERMFQFYQCGPDGLCSQFDRTMVGCIPTAEAYYRLGMTNSALRYFFDIQESILNCSKSSWFSQRIAECYVANGRYDIARKYINDLKKTIFYSKWARDVERCLCSEEMINTHPSIGRLRKTTFNENFIYSSREMTTMMMQLWISNKSNNLAFEYMMASMMLKCDVATFHSVSPLLQNIAPQRMPRHYQEMMAMFWLQGMGEPYEPLLTSEIKKEVKAFDTAYLMAHDRDKFLQGKWGKTYWGYCMIASQFNASTGATSRTLH